MCGPNSTCNPEIPPGELSPWLGTPVLDSTHRVHNCMKPIVLQSPKESINLLTTQQFASIHCKVQQWEGMTGIGSMKNLGMGKWKKGMAKGKKIQRERQRRGWI